MANLLETWRESRRGAVDLAPAEPSRSIMTIDDYVAALSDMVLEGAQAWGFGPSQVNWQYEPAERITHSFEGYSRQLVESNGLVYAVMGVRILAFSLVRFSFQSMRNGRGAKLFGTPSLAQLERPWTGGTTQDLLMRIMQDADVAGNAYITRAGPELVRLRPDWVQIILMPITTDSGGLLGWRRVGYTYHDGGIDICPPERVALLAVNEVAHFAPRPALGASYRGESWLTAVVREIVNDKMMLRHQTKFFENAAPQPLDAPVLTPRGWSTMGSMVVGSEVIGSDGKPHRVTGVFPQGKQAIYRVRFADGTGVECTADHVWTVQTAYDRKRGVTRNLTCERLAADLAYRSGPSKYAVPFVDPVQYDDPGTLPVDPYLLGLLLGDGSMRGNGAGSGAATLAADARDADDTAQALAARVPPAVQVTRRDRGGWAEFYLGAGGQRNNPLTEALRELGVWGVAGPEKTVPTLYLRASVSDRLALLRGLLDSDGSVDTRQPNLVRFTSRSRALAEAVNELARSLGGTATVIEVPAKRQWTVRVKRLPAEMVPFGLSRKAAAYRPPGNRGERHRFVVGVEYVGRKPAQCIRVDTPDSLYVTEGFVLTHNTPNISVSLHESISPEMFAEFKEKMNIESRGLENAYKTLFLGGGADVNVIGANLQQIAFDSVQGRGETRVAAVAGVPPIIVGLSEGLSASTYSNYGQAMRRFGELTLASLWGNVAGSLATLVPPPGVDSRLWYDTRDVAFLREDAERRAAVQQQKAATINTYITAGFTPQSAVEAAVAEDETLLEHTGLVSVQLQPPGTVAEPATPAADTPAPAASNAGGRNTHHHEHDGALSVDDTDRALMYANAHPHPALALTNGSTPNRKE